MALLVLAGVNLVYATDASTTVVDPNKPPVVDFYPNPHEAGFEAAKTALQSSYDALEKLYNSFDFNALTEAYYAYAKAYSAYFAIKAKYDEYEAAYAVRLFVRTVALDVTKVQGIDLPWQPDYVIEDTGEDQAVVQQCQRVEVGIQSKLTVVPFHLPFPWKDGAQKDAKTFDTNAQGLLIIKHFKAGQIVSLMAEAPGCKEAVALVKLEKNAKKLMHLERLSASVKGHVYGLPKLPVNEKQPNVPPIFRCPLPTNIRTVPLAGVTVNFTHLATKQTFQTVTSQGAWRKIRIVPKHWPAAAGRYFIKSMPEGEYEVTITKEGYRPFKNKMSLKAGEEPTEQNFVLVPGFDHPLADDDDKDTTTTGTTTTGTQATDDFENPLGGGWQ
jgi:hypothetical protein